MVRKETEHGYYTTDELGRFHSFNDEPAIVVNSYSTMDENEVETITEGYQAWYKNGELHRDNDLPAVIRDNGTKFYYIDGQFIREENE
jgi:uncharacterized protein CbrC (UPF0167 family)